MSDHPPSSLPAPPTPDKKADDGTAPTTAAAGAHEAEADAEDAAVMDAMELHLLTLNECFIYAVPRLATATGYRADDWGLAKPLVTGSLKCYRKGDDRLFLRIYASPPQSAQAAGLGEGAAERPATPRLFAEAPIYLGKGPKGEAPPPLEASFTPVTDSSRYFVLKVVDPSVSATGSSQPQRARHAFLGIGFREREDAFALKACVQDFVAYHERMAKAEQLRAEDLKAWEQQEHAEGGDADADAALSPLPPEVQARVAALGLKEGEKLRISLGHAMEGKGYSGQGHRHTPTLSASSPGAAGGDVVPPLLPPPPGDRSPAIVGAGNDRGKEGGGGGDGQEEEWGDFVA